MIVVVEARADQGAGVGGVEEGERVVDDGGSESHEWAGAVGVEDVGVGKAHPVVAGGEGEGVGVVEGVVGEGKWFLEGGLRFMVIE